METIGVIGFCKAYTGVIVNTLGIHRDIGKEKGNYYLGSRVLRFVVWGLALEVVARDFRGLKVFGFRGLSNTGPYA